MVVDPVGADALIDRRIRELCLKEHMVTPFTEQAVQPCSYDVHVGYEGQIETRDGFKKVDLSIYSDNCPLYLPPGTFMLTDTVEYLKIPNNVEAHLHLVSSRARQGYQHALSGLIDAGYSGRPTLEIKNNLQYGNLPIYPKLRIAQLTFFEYQEAARRPYRGRYFEDVSVSNAKDGSDLLRD